MKRQHLKKRCSLEAVPSPWPIAIVPWVFTTIRKLLHRNFPITEGRWRRSHSPPFWEKSLMADVSDSLVEYWKTAQIWFRSKVTCSYYSLMAIWWLVLTELMTYSSPWASIYIIKTFLDNSRESKGNYGSGDYFKGGNKPLAMGRYFTEQEQHVGIIVSCTLTTSVFK